MLEPFCSTRSDRGTPVQPLPTRLQVPQGVPSSCTWTIYVGLKPDLAVFRVGNRLLLSFYCVAIATNLRSLRRFECFVLEIHTTDLGKLCIIIPTAAPRTTSVVEAKCIKMRWLNPCLLINSPNWWPPFPFHVLLNSGVQVCFVKVLKSKSLFVNPKFHAFPWYRLVMTNSSLLKMVIEIVSFSINSMVMFHSYATIYQRVFTILHHNSLLFTINHY